MKLLLASLVLLASTYSHAELTGSVSLGKLVLEHQPFERSASVGYRLHLGESWFVKPTLGGWIGGRGEPSWFVGAPVGVQVWIPISGLYGFISVGPARISNPDWVLGGYGQFMTEFGFGLKNDSKNIEIVWQHLSSAGLVMPNLGRDFVGVQVGF
jgi:hypothetical protein